MTPKPLEFASVVAGRKPGQCHAKVAELVDALASGVSVLTDVRVQFPLFVPAQPQPIGTTDLHAMVAELVDALASGVSVLSDVRVQVPPFAPIGGDADVRLMFQ